MLTKEISEVEKEMLKDAIMKVLDSEEHKLFIKIFPTIIKTHIKIKDEALKSCQAKFDRFVEDLHIKIDKFQKELLEIVNDCVEKEDENK
jgi:hypothetical protein